MKRVLTQYNTITVLNSRFNKSEIQNLYLTVVKIICIMAIKTYIVREV